MAVSFEEKCDVDLVQSCAVSVFLHVTSGSLSCARDVGDPVVKEWSGVFRE